MSRGKGDRRHRQAIRDALAKAFAAKVKRTLEAARQTAECDVGVSVIETSPLHVRFTARIDDVSGIATVGYQSIEKDVAETVDRLMRVWIARRAAA